MRGAKRKGAREENKRARQGREGNEQREPKGKGGSSKAKTQVNENWPKSPCGDIGVIASSKVNRCCD